MMYGIVARTERPKSAPEIVEGYEEHPNIKTLRANLKDRYASPSPSVTSCYIYRTYNDLKDRDLIGALYVTRTPNGSDTVWAPILGYAYHVKDDGTLGEVVV